MSSCHGIIYYISTKQKLKTISLTKAVLELATTYHLTYGVAYYFRRARLVC